MPLPTLLLLLLLLAGAASAGSLPRDARAPSRRGAAADVADYTHNEPPPLLVSPNAGRGWEGDGQDAANDEDEELATPHLFAECCARSADGHCRRACLAALGGSLDGAEAAGGEQLRTRPRLTLGRLVDAVQAAGCELLLHDPLFLCLVSRSGGHGQGDGQGDGPGPLLDGARLHCCGLARATGCRRACHAAHRDDWAATATGRGGPLQQCLARANESLMASCLEEVDAPCQPASRCAGLDFCVGVLPDTDHDDGDGRWFRSCSAEADGAARLAAVRWWRDGGLPGLGLALPDGGELADRVPLVRGTRACGPGLWRALACLLHARPCSPRVGSLPLCEDDCLRLLPRCVRWSAVPAGFSAERLCAEVAGPPPCVRLAPEQDDDLLDDADVAIAGQPARPGADADAAASVDPDSDGRCRVGAASDVVVAAGTAVRVPVEACYAACLCEAGSLQRCAALRCPPHASLCRLGANTIEHRRTVTQDCLVCSCSSGDVLCTQRQCAAAGSLDDENPAAAACPCPAHRVPVCGRNGRTYGNACLARCAGLGDADGDVRPGACPQHDPCASRLCPGRRACVPAKVQCLSLLVQPCPQYECVEVPAACDAEDKVGPVACDTQGRSHASVCALLRAGASLLHLGPCLSDGGHGKGLEEGEAAVCGADGLTYSSRGAAREARVPVDYAGPCGAECTSARCPALPPGCLRGVRPGAACCAACAPVLHAAVDTKALDRAMLAVSRLARPWPRLHAAFSLQALLDQLQREVLERCEVQGFLAPGDQLVVVLVPPTEAGAATRCYLEAQRLAGLFEQSAARLQSSLLLSAVLAVDLLPAPLTAPTSPPAPDAAPGGGRPDVGMLLLLLLLLSHYALRRRP